MRTPGFANVRPFRDIVNPGHSPAGLVALQRRTMRTIVVSQVLSGVGLTAGITVGGLLGEGLMGARGWSGLPAALFTFGSAMAALSVGELSQRFGRRVGLATGYLAAAAGGATTVVGAAFGWVPLFLLGLLVYGAGIATNLLARYAGTDLAPPERRGTVISTVMVATTLGAVVGPNLVDQAGVVARIIGVPRLAGPFIVASVAYACAAAVVLVYLRPDPLLVARALVADPHALGAPSASHHTERSSIDWARMVEAIASIVVAQLVMLAVMTMTPVFMRDHDHSLGATGFVISAHVAAMFLPSPLTGRLVDRVGRRPIMLAGALVLVAAGVFAAYAPSDSVAAIAIALALLGLGWNLSVVAGTAHMTDATPLEYRARVQGITDVGLAVAGSVGGLGSGLVVAARSFAFLGLLSAAVAGLALPILLVAIMRNATSERRRTS